MRISLNTATPIMSDVDDIVYLLGKQPEDETIADQPGGGPWCRGSTSDILARRNMWRAIFGIVHCYLIWQGGTLFAYGMTTLLSMVVRQDGFSRTDALSNYLEFSPLVRVCGVLQALLRRSGDVDHPSDVEFYLAAFFLDLARSSSSGGRLHIGPYNR
jgi:hypothetical protein